MTREARYLYPELTKVRNPLNSALAVGFLFEELRL